MTVARSGRFESERDPTFVRLNSSLALDWRLWPEDIEGSRAHARALRRARVLNALELDAILSGLDGVAAEIAAGDFVPSDEDEDVHMAIERRLIELIGAPGAKLHTGRSRNDQVVTDVRLELRHVIDRQDPALGALQEALLEQAEQHVETVLPSYTHLQRAQVTSLAHHLLAYFWMLDRDRRRLAAVRAACQQLPLGAGAAVGLNYELDRDAEAVDLGFDGVIPNSLDAVSDRDFVVEYLGFAALLGAHLSRLGAELVLWATAEFGFVRLSDAFSGGSSIMPQKRNPDAAELTRAAAPRLTADLGGLLGVLHALPLAYSTDLREDKRYLFDAVDCLDELLPVITGVVAGARFQAVRMRAACESALLSTDVADYLVKNGMPFREAHHLVGGLVRRAEESGVDIFSLPEAEVAELSPALDAGYRALADPSASLAGKSAAGGSSPERVHEQLDLARRAMDAAAARRA
jgi:argininosuccinate lyase